MSDEGVGTPKTGDDEKSGEPKQAATTLDELRKAVEDTQLALERAKAKLASGEGKEKSDKENEALVKAYADELKTLRADQEAAENYLASESKCLDQILSTEVVKDVLELVAREHDAIATAKAAFDKSKTELEDKKQGLANSTKARDELKEQLEMLKKPAAAIKDRLKRLDGFKTEVKKAHDAGEFAVAYWLLVEKFAGELKADPKLIEPDALSAKINETAEKLSETAADVSSLEATITSRTRSLEADKKRLDELEKTLDGRIREQLHKPPSAAAAA